MVRLERLFGLRSHPTLRRNTLRTAEYQFSPTLTLGSYIEK